MAGKWKPKVGEKYWMIDILGVICWRNNGYSFVDKRNFYFGNCFKTKKQAEAVLRKIKGGRG